MNDSRSAVPVLADLVQAPVAAPWLVDWSAVQTKLGSGLPSDYKEYVTRFGPGFLEEGYIRIATPGIPDDWRRNYEFFDHVRLGSMRLRASRERVAYPIWPEPGGLLSWGRPGMRTCSTGTRLRDIRTCGRLSRALADDTNGSASPAA